jgi:large subunit ribosomal protein L17
MRHLRKGRKLSRKKKQREALMKIMAGELFRRGKMKTTEAKAKELKVFAEKICSAMKKSLLKEDKKNVQSLVALRQVRSMLPQSARLKILPEISKSIARRKSGFLRIVKLGSRRSDGASMAILEIIMEEEAKKQ